MREWLLYKSTIFYFSVLDQKKIQNLMRESGKKKHLGKKNIEPIFEKVNEGDQIKKHFSGKVNEGDEIKKTFDLFKKKLMRATDKTSKKNIAEKKIIS